MNPNHPEPTKESSREGFNLKAWFYDFTVDESTGEVLQKEFVYVGKLRRKKLLQRNIRLENELDALLYELFFIQSKCEKVICYDNNKAKGVNEVFRLEKGILKNSRLKNYELQIRKFLPHYKFTPHEIQS